MNNSSDIEKESDKCGKNKMSLEKILKPGTKIRPNISMESVENLVQRLYGIVAHEIKELISYDDRNFLIYEDKNVKNPLITHQWPHGYVLKILNSHDSQTLAYVEAQIELMIFIRKQNIVCPNPIKNVYGKYYSMESINDSQNVVRLLEFQPGKIFHEISFTNNLFYQTGEFVAQLDKTIKSFSHPGLQDHETLWMLQSIPMLKNFLYVIKDFAQKQIVEEVIEAFEKNVLVGLENFETGVIHGDFNEQNIIVSEIKDHNEYHVSGIIDFGDINISPYIFELAIALTYMMLQSKDISTGGLVIAGYSSIRLIPKEEKEILKYCVVARLCQSLVLGCYTYLQDPENEYLLTTQKAGWNLLGLIWKDSFDKIDSIWDTVADNYLKQSVK